MNNLRGVLAAILLIATVTLVSCKDKNTDVNTEVEVTTETNKTTEKKGMEYTADYVCPMHCKESGSDQVGTCSTCGMALVKNEDHKADGHKHENH